MIDIDKLEAGRELDALVGESIFRWKWVRRAYSDETMRQAFEFVQRDFERFLELMRWLDALPDASLKAQVGALEDLRGKPNSLLRPASKLAPAGCHCKPGRCAAPVVMGQQVPCRDPEKAAMAPEVKP